MGAADDSCVAGGRGGKGLVEGLLGVLCGWVMVCGLVVAVGDGWLVLDGGGFIGVRYSRGSCMVSGLLVWAGE